MGSFRRYSPLVTDLYEVTMASGYWKVGMQDRRAVFHLFFRRLPFKGGYCVACGLGEVIEYFRDLRFDDEDLGYLGALRGDDGHQLFEVAFLDYLRTLE